MFRRIFFLVLSLTWAANAFAQTVTDERIWFTQTLQKTGTPDKPWGATFETILRSRDGFDALDTMGLRPTVIYTVDKHSSVGGGYAFVPGFPASGGTTVEQRIYGQYGWTGPLHGGTLTLRTRMESRFIEGNSGALGRFRQRVQFSHAVRKGSRLSLVVYDELFIHVNDTTRSARGVDHNRIYGGISLSAAKRVRVEAGYLNYFSPGHRGAADRRYHVLSTGLVVSF